MIRRDISFLSAWENLYFDDVLLGLAQAGQSGEVLRFWESPSYFIVLGRTSEEREDVIIDEVQKDHISVLRRCSGGGTVLQGPGCLNYTLILSKDHCCELETIQGSYRYILNKLKLALKALNIDCVIHFPSDMALTHNQRKFSGNAQKRSKSFILHHGTLLYAFDLSLIDRYLHLPKTRPEYRKDRAHGEFVTNLSVDVASLKENIAYQFCAVRVDQALSYSEQQRLSLLAQRNNALFHMKALTPVE